MLGAGTLFDWEDGSAGLGCLGSKRRFFVHVKVE
jgi:hypothetical protein